MKRIFIAFLAITYCMTCHAEEQFIFTRISKNEGFTSTVNCIYKERNGDVWMGAPNGLYSFDGSSLSHHTDPLLKGCSVLCLDSDDMGNFWILTDRSLFLKMNGVEDLMEMRTGDMAERQVFLCLCKDNEGVWIGSNRKIYRYSYADKLLTLFKELKETSTFVIQDISLLDENTLLCSSFNGMITVDIATKEVSDAEFGENKGVSAMMTDSKGRIWVASYNRGLEVFDRNGTILKRYTTEDSELTNNMILCMTEKDSVIWAGTDGGGINIIDPDNDRISVLRHISGDVSSFPAHSIKSIYTDDYGNIWAGSVRDGLIRISRSGMKTYTDSHIGTDKGLSNPTVLCLYQDTYDGCIWIGTDGEGINRFNRKTGRFTHYDKTLETKVVSIASFSDTELALSVYSDRIWLFDRKTGNMRAMDLKDDYLENLFKYAGRSFNLANETDGNLILFSNTIWRYDKATGKCRRITNPGKGAENSNYFMIGRTEEGLWFHNSTHVFSLAEGQDCLQVKGKLDDALIRAGHIAPDGLIWFATDNGVYRFNPDVMFFDKISTNLFSDAVSVVCDTKSQVWIGTENGLYAYLSDTKGFARFGESDGAAPIEFLSKARLLSSEGEVYMGGVEGLLHIGTDYSIDMEEEPQILLKEITADGNKLYQGKRGSYRLPRHSHAVRISVSAQETDIFRQKMFRFRFSKGSEIYESQTNVLDLQRPPKPGKHDVTVECIKRNGEWTEPVHLLTLSVPQPWYKSVWFLLSMAGLAILISGLSVHYMLRRKERMLQMAIKEKDRQIYEEKVRMLINMSHELRTPLTLIMAPLKRFLDNMKPDDNGYEEMNRVYRQSRRMKELLNMVLDLRKMEVGMSDLKIEKVDFNVWVREMSEDIVHEEHTRGVNVVLELSPEVGIVECDRKKCDTVLSNLLINAVKHSREGDTITLRTGLTEEGMVRTSITDQGPGLHNIDAEKLFTRFYQSNNEGYGSGIGLSYSKILVELHGGRIAAENNPDKGATFWWEIPQRAESSYNQIIPAKAYLNELMGYDPGDNFSAPESETFNTADMKLMLVDDSQELLDFLKEALQQDFAEIVMAHSGNKAYAELSSGKLPDIIISDVNMPDGNGYALCKRLKENEKYNHIPVILLTARGEQQSQSDSYRMGADAFMAKPFEIETLLELARNILKQKAEIRRRYLDKDDKAASVYGSDEENFILKLNKVIAEHLDDPCLDQQILCTELGMSRAALFNRMKSITGAGAKEYITRIRLEKAKNLIENSNLTIAEISEKTGFASQSYFSTAFKNYTGMTPSQYKKSGNL